MASSISLPSFANNAANIVGRTDGLAPAAGGLGESTRSAPVSDVNWGSSGTMINIHSLTLPAGRWLVTAQAQPASGSVYVEASDCYMEVGISTTSATLQASESYGFARPIPRSPLTSQTLGCISPAARVIDSSGSTIIYLVGSISYTSNTGGAWRSNVCHLRYTRIA